ncbi:MAG: STAS domain-containing protein [Negativicutes bacterium]|nr:STAS domain-containing protein [Negativicutes bacterium]
MDIRVTTSGNDVSVTFSGEMHVEEAAKFREDMLELIKKGAKQFELDMSQLKYIDSSGLGVLVALHKRAREHGGQVTIKGVNGSVKQLFELTRLTKVFTILP